MTFQFKNAKVSIKDNPIISKGGKEVVVHVEASNSSKKPVSMDLSTYQSGSRYRVYNVAMEGVSLVTVYHGQPNEAVKSKGIDSLVDELKTKNSGKANKS